jgi:hypothetical protein
MSVVPINSDTTIAVPKDADLTNLSADATRTVFTAAKTTVYNIRLTVQMTDAPAAGKMGQYSLYISRGATGKWTGRNADNKTMVIDITTALISGESFSIHVVNSGIPDNAVAQCALLAFDAPITV